MQLEIFQLSSSCCEICHFLSPQREFIKILSKCVFCLMSVSLSILLGLVDPTGPLMVFILDGNSEIGAYGRSNLCYLTFQRHSIKSRAVIFFYPKRPIFIHACATWSEYHGSTGSRRRFHKVQSNSWPMLRKSCVFLTRITAGYETT